MRALLLAMLVPSLALAAGEGRRGSAEKGSSEVRRAAAEKAAAEKAASASTAPAPAAAAPVLPSSRGPTRIDFDDRMVSGQTNKLGAVYLYQRKTPPQASLLSRRTSFRDEISRDLLE